MKIDRRVSYDNDGDDVRRKKITAPDALQMQDRGWSQRTDERQHALLGNQSHHHCVDVIHNVIDKLTATRRKNIIKLGRLS